METFSTLFSALLIWGALLSIPLYLLFKSFASSSSQIRWTARILLCGIILFLSAIYSFLDRSVRRVKSRQSEAKQALGTIAKNQEAYFAEFQTYADSSRKLGFSVRGEGGKRYYTYSYSGVSATGYTAIATSLAPGISNCGGGESDDVWTINEKLSLQNTESAIEHNQKCYFQRYFYFIAVFFVFFVLYDLFICKPKSEISEHQG